MPFADDGFGVSLRFDGTRLLVGSPVSVRGEESAFLFERDGTTAASRAEDRPKS